jgi:hypothetical protein
MVFSPVDPGKFLMPAAGGIDALCPQQSEKGLVQ